MRSVFLFLTWLFLLCVFIAFGCGYAWERYDGEDPSAGDTNGDSPPGIEDDDDDDSGSDDDDKINNFTWTTVDGDSLTLYDYEGYVVLLNVGAGWCEGCKEETPFLETMFWQRFQDRQFVVIQLLTETAEGQPADIAFAEEWRDEYGITFPLCIDPDWSLEPYFKENTLPFTMLLDRNLIIRVRTHGFDGDILSALVERFL